MKIHTNRFGSIEVEEKDFIYFKRPILGFEHLTRFVLLVQKDHNPFLWLQSVDNPAVAFVVVNPRVIKDDYNPRVFENDLDFLGIKNDEDIALLSIVTIRTRPLRITANLRAPLLINAENRMASQVLLEDDDYPLQYNIMEKIAEPHGQSFMEQSTCMRLGKHLETVPQC